MPSMASVRIARKNTRSLFQNLNYPIRSSQTQKINWQNYLISMVRRNLWDASVTQCTGLPLWWMNKASLKALFILSTQLIIMTQILGITKPVQYQMNATLVIYLSQRRICLQITGSTDLVILDCRYSLADVQTGRRDFHAGTYSRCLFYGRGAGSFIAGDQGSDRASSATRSGSTCLSLRAAGLKPASKVVVYDQSNGMSASRAWWLTPLAWA